MMDDETIRLLNSDKPSQRSLAIDHLRRQAKAADINDLRAAMRAETVPMLRRQLAQVVRAVSQPSAASGSEDATPARTKEDGARLEDDFVHWMRHELEPGIGWLMLAASDEVPGFDGSETRFAIDGLNSRLDSVEALIRASAPPRYEVLSLSEVIQHAVRITGIPQSRLSLDVGGDVPDDIATDGNLLRLLLVNATRNAYEAVLDMPGEYQVYITAGVTPAAFWVKVSNRFVGTEFSLDDVSGKGVSAKIGHQGQGFGIMRIAAARLGYELLMQAEAGLAIFTLRGRRKIE